MGLGQWSLIDWFATLIPVAIVLGALRIGSRQVREFRARTGDRGFITALAALSLPSRVKSDDSPSSSIAEQPLPRRRAEAEEPELDIIAAE